jgi:DNA-binding IclR family transcriptional regulator
MSKDQPTENDSGSPRYIKSVVTAFRLLEEIKNRSGATLVELTETSDLTKGTVHTYLETLRSQGYVEKNDNGYDLDLMFIPASEYVRNQTLLYQEGVEEIDKLAIETKEYVHMTTFFERGQVALYEARGENSIGTEYYRRMREDLQQLYASSTGKAMLAEMSNDQVRSILPENELESKTENTITSMDEFLSELERIRDRGYAVNDEEDLYGMRAVGTSISVLDGEILGAVSLTSPISRMSGERFNKTVPEKIIHTANVIELNIETRLVEPT